MATEQSSTFQERVARWRAQEDAAVTEADRLRSALEERRLRREQNKFSIESKLFFDGSKTVILSPRKRARLTHELHLLRTYDTRHPVGEAAVNKHIWIKFGLNYQAVMDHRAT